MTKPISPVEEVYGYLICEFHRHCIEYGSGHFYTVEIENAIRTLERLWPEDCKRWINRFSTEWVCPIGNKDCKENCGNYGCGN